MDLQELKENPSRYIKSFAMDIVVVVVSFAYIFYQVLSFEKTDLNIWVLLAQSAMGIICGVIIKQSLGENGFSKGYNSKLWNDEEDKYNRACNSAIPFIDRVDNFYIAQEIEKRANYRRQKLQGIRLKYKEWFDDNGNYIGTKEMETKLDRRQKRILHKCIRVKIYVLNLFSEYETSSEQDTRKEETDKKKRSKNISKNAISATIIAIIGVYFVPILNWSWASLIASTLQVALWVLFGFMQLYDNYNFVINDRVAILKTKKEKIALFTTNCEKYDMYKTNPYEDIEKSVDTKVEDKVE